MKYLSPQMVFVVLLPAVLAVLLRPHVARSESTAVDELKAAMEAHSHFKAISFQSTTTLQQTRNGKLEVTSIEQSEYVLVNEGFHYKIQRFDQDNHYQSSLIAGKYGDTNIFYSPEVKSATIHRPENTVLPKATILPMMASSLGGHNLADFQFKNQPTTFEHIFQTEVDKPVLAPGMTQIYLTPDPASIHWKLFVLGHEDGQLVLGATGRFGPQASEVVKAWLDPSRGWLITRQDFFDYTGRLTGRFVLEQVDHAGNITYPTRGKFTEFSFPADQPPLIVYDMTVQKMSFLPSMQNIDLSVNIPDGTDIHDLNLHKEYVKGAKNIPELDNQVKYLGK